MRVSQIGNTNATRKLTERDAQMIRELHAWKQEQIRIANETASAKSLARKFDVHVRTIEKVLRWETFRRVIREEVA